jgi:hypothetical protein
MIYIIDNIEIEAVNIKVAKSIYKKRTGYRAIRASVKDVSKPKPDLLSEEECIESKLKQAGLL